MSDSRTALDAVLSAIGPSDVVRVEELKHRTGLSQPTIARALAELRPRVVQLGRGRNSNYAKAAPLYGLATQLPVWWFDEAGEASRWGTISHLEDGRLHLDAAGTTWGPAAGVPWPLATLRRQGFLGRITAEAPAIKGLLGTEIDAWPAAAHLYAAAIAGGDLPGAIAVGDPPLAESPRVPSEVTERIGRYEAMADDVAHALPPGSSAGGDQPKFLAVVDAPTPAHVLVKFSPPLNTPFGERWSDLLHAEAIALEVLGGAGFPAAKTQVLVGPKRTFLESTRFDRFGLRGRKHVLPLDAVHDAFVGTPRQHWAHSCDELARQRRLSRAEAETVRLWRAVGRLIANTDMHFGNLSLWVDDVRRGRFSLAPCYDMLPMQYRPGDHRDDLGPTPFSVPTPGLEELAVWSRARALAETIWRRASESANSSGAWRVVCAENARRVARAG
jgi:hypothetical protein